MSPIPVGLQLYSVREECARDLPKTLAAVAGTGFAAVEFAGYHNRTAKELRKLLDGNGLKCCGTHTGLDTLTGDALQHTVEFNQEIGNKFLIVPWIPGEKFQGAACLATAREFNEIAEKLAPFGMQTGYHNHQSEFAAVDGKSPWDTFFGNTVPSVVMQLDTGNALAGGADLLKILRAYPGRPATVHLKPYSRKVAAKDGPDAGFRPIIGEDEVPWAKVFSLCEGQGKTKWYIVEYESDAFQPLEAVKRCRDALKAMGR
jgi:sugar phosphate isomerase/epimerase